MQTTSCRRISGFFQSLEKLGRNFPIIGKIAFALALPALNAAADSDWNGELNFYDGAYQDNQTPVTNSAGNIFYQWIETGTGGGSYCLFQWNSWATKIGADQAGPYALTLSDGLAIDGRVRFENGSGCSGTATDFTLSGRETGKTYVINLSDAGTVLQYPCNDSALALAINEVNHTSALVAFGTPETSNDEAYCYLNAKNASAENAGSNEEMWFMWTTNDWVTRSFAVVTDIVAGTTLRLRMTNDVARGALVKWLAITTATTSTGTLSASTSGVLNFDLAAIKRSATQTYGIDYSNLGNAWHLPANAEPVGAYMRNPQNPYSNNTVTIYNGNQFQGDGNAADQTGGTLYHRLAGAAGWQTSALSFTNETGNNKYWFGTIPAGTYAATNEVEYYLKVTYNDRDDTYLGTTNNGAGCVTYATNAVPTNHPFRFTYGGEPGTEAGFIWHNTNRVNLGSGRVQFWVKIGYAEGIGSNRWIDHAAVYYTTNGLDPAGARGTNSGSGTMVQLMTFDHMEADISDNGDAMWWMATVTNLPDTDGSTIKYRIGAWKTSTERFAEYNTSGADDAVFSFSLFVAGADGLTVNGVNADYTTTKFFIDEIAGETQFVTVVYTPSESGASNAQVYANLNRRDLCDVDYTNAYLAGDGYPDGIRPPDGNVIGTNDTGAYFTAFAMSGGPTTFYWTGAVSRCGAYRLTARHQKDAVSPTNWTWYSSPGGLRDHAIVVSPRKVHGQTMYELDTLTVEATDNNESGRSTFADLLGADDGDTDGYDPFNLEYLDRLNVNCLWFQPIHPNAGERKDEYTPGSPYATKNYFAVSRYYGADGTEAGAMAEFTNFVAHCDAFTGAVGTINVMLDGVFNHTAWDAVFGEAGTNFNFCTNANDRIGWFRPAWYAHWEDYGSNATYYHSAYSNDIATAPDRGDFGKWSDVAELYFGKYSALVRHNPDNNGDYLNEGDVYDFTGMITNTMELWKFFAYYPEFWLKKTGHSGTNSFVQALDDRGIDGLRCDFGQGLPPQLWEYLINRTRRMKWNFLFMAETLDGGKPGYRSNRHFDVLNENLVFRFTQEHINDCWDLRSALEDRRSAYSGGAVLLNLTSHDEVLPDSDKWLTASRYAAVSAVDGIPMIFYGQEQGIENWAGAATKNTGFKTDHEENFGKYIPNFKQWNQLTVWTNPPDYATGLPELYARINSARHASPALQSPNRYFLSKTTGGDEARIFAVAKYQTAGASPHTSDVVLAFALMLRHGESPHAGTNATYDLRGSGDYLWNLLGLNTGKFYNVRNLASSGPDTYLWAESKSGTELYTNGIWVDLPADNGGTTAITNDGVLVQYLKLDEINSAPQISLPGPHILPVGAWTNFTVTASDPDGDPVLLTNPTAPAGAVFAGGVFTWTAGVANVNTTNTAAFVADDQQGAANSVVTNSTSIVVPLDWDNDGMSDGWEWTWFLTLTNEASGDNDGDHSDNLTEYIAGTEPTDAGSVFSVDHIVSSPGHTNRLITIPTQPGKHYTIQYADDLGTNGITWFGFGNTNDGIGTWAETNSTAATHTFTDDETADTTTNTPAAGRRFYRVKVR